MDYLNRAELACKREMVRRSNYSQENMAVLLALGFVLYFIVLFSVCAVFGINLIG